MKNLNTLYCNMSDQHKYDLLCSLYLEQHKSFADIAEECDTYANKIRRDAKRLQIPIRNKSEAQKNALSSGKHKHPTKGQCRSNTVKKKIGKGVMDVWENLSEIELLSRKEKSKKNWDKLTEDEKKNMQKAATDAVRISSKKGSKLEKFILTQLLTDGYYVEFHKEQTLVNTRLQIDMFLPTINTAIEVDGPSHFLPVWGEDALRKNISYDQKKEGLIIGKGWNLIRIKQLRDFSDTRAYILYEKLNKALKDIIVSNMTTQTLLIEDDNE
jgi:very-short-patch-repair endonuclease